MTHRDEIRARYSTDLARARANAPTGKEPFDEHALAGYVLAGGCSLGSPHHVGPYSDEEWADYLLGLEYEYYLQKPQIMTMRAFAQILCDRDLYG